MDIGYISHTVIYTDKKEILITKRSSHENVFPNLWDIPGGKVEEGEDPEAGALREIKEEVGLNFKKLTPLSQSSEIDSVKNKQYIRKVYITKYEGGDIILSHDHEEYKWVLISDLDKFDCIPYMKELAIALEEYWK